MKKLSISTFGIFVFCLCLRTYSYISYKELEQKVNSNEALLSDDKKKTIALLNTLNDLTDSPIKPENNFREVSSDELKKQRKIDSLIISFIEGFYASRDNLTELRKIQKEIQKLNKETDTIGRPLSFLDLNLIYYFVIRENFEIRDFQKDIIFEDIGFNREKLEEIRKLSNSDEFKVAIFKFKNIYIKEEVQDIESEPRENNSLAIEDKAPSLEFEDLPEETQIEFLKAADDQEVDLEEKLLELDYTQEEIDEMLSGFEL